MAAKLTKEACRAARGLLGVTTHEFASQLGVSPTTINGIEAGNPVRASTERKIIEALDALGVEITNGNGTGARLRFDARVEILPLNYWRIEASDRANLPFTARQFPQQLREAPLMPNRSALEAWLSVLGWAQSEIDPDVWVEANDKH